MNKPLNSRIAIGIASMLLIAGIILIYERNGVLAWLSLILGAGIILKAWYRPSNLDLPLAIATPLVIAAAWGNIFYYVISTWETGDVVELNIQTSEGSHIARTWILEEPEALVLYYDAPGLIANALTNGASLQVTRNGNELNFDSYTATREDEMTSGEIDHVFNLMSEKYGDRVDAADIFYGFLGRASDKVGVVIRLPKTMTEGTSEND